MVVRNVWINTQDRSLPRLAFFASRDINVGEELTFDYDPKASRGEHDGKEFLRLRNKDR